MPLDGLRTNHEGCSESSQIGDTPSRLKARNGRSILSPTKANAQRKQSQKAAEKIAQRGEVETPKSSRFKDVLSENIPTTPKHRVRVSGKAFSTPSSNRHPATPVSRPPSVYSAPRQLFSQGLSPSRLIGRDQEKERLNEFITEAIKQRQGGCLYVSGPPGTGKSAIVEEVLHHLPSDEHLMIASVNCVSMKSAKDVITKLAQDFCDQTTSMNAPDKALSSVFVPKRPANTLYLVMLDEIDHLLATDLEALYLLFQWSLDPKSQLLLLGIANALDLTDRLLPRLKTRNLKPQLLSFRPYTAPQISSIITTKLQSLVSKESSASPNYTPFLHPAAILLCAKKVASQTGDLRKAFEIVRRVVDRIEREIIENEMRDQPTTSSPASRLHGLPSPPTSSPIQPPTPTQTPTKSAILSHLTPLTAPRATIAHVASITSGIFNSGTAPRLASLNLQQKAALCALLAAEKKRARRVADPFSTPTKAGRAPTTPELWGVYVGLCKREEMLHPLTATEFRDVVASLETLGLVGEVKGKSAATPSKRAMGFQAFEGKGLSSQVNEKEMMDAIEKGEAGKEILKVLLRGEI